MVYISNSTELGTIYLAKELEELSEFCKQNRLYLFMDGARLGHGLTAEISDLTLKKWLNLQIFSIWVVRKTER
jgi:threonine aldolase